MFVFTRPGRWDSHAVAAEAAAASIAATLTTAAATATDENGSGSRGGARGVGAGRSRPNAVHFSRNHVPTRTGSAIRQGRQSGGQGREKRGVSSQTPTGPWHFAVQPYPGRFSPALLHGGNRFSRGRSAVRSRTSEAQSGQPPRRQEEKRSYSSSLAKPIHSSRPSPHALEQEVRSTQKSNFPASLAQESLEQQDFYVRRRIFPSLADRTNMGGAELSQHSTQNSKFCVNRDEDCQISRTAQTWVVRNFHTPQLRTAGFV